MNTELAKLLRDEEVRLLYERTPAVLMMSLVVSVFLSLAVWIQTHSVAIFHWLFIVDTYLLIRFAIHRFFILSGNDRPLAPYVVSLYIFLSGLSGLIWGSCLFITTSESLTDIMPIALVLSGMMSGAVSGLSYVRSASIAYLMPVGLMLAYAIYSFGGDISVVLALLVLFYMFTCIYFGNKFNRVLKDTLWLRHENAELMESLKTQRDIAERANIDKSRFLAAASHDMRQPLHAMSLFMDILKTSETEQERHTLFKKMDLSLNALNDLFNGLLDISKLDAGDIEADISDFYVSDILNDVIHEFEVAAKKKNLRFIMRNEELAVRTDYFLLTRVLRNLIGNAIKYTDNGGILISCRQRSDHVLLQIWDTGMGIPEFKLEDIFLEFKQLHNPHRDREQGLGLGLAIVQRLCNLMNHKLNVRSNLGKGSVFSIVLPIGDVKEEESTITNQQVTGWDQMELVVLVIDDEREILGAMQELLQKWGCKVITADSLGTAIEKLDESALQLDLVLADMRLRNDETGIDAIDSIRKKYGSSIEGVLITGDTAVERISMVKDSGYKVLYKPVKPLQLGMLVNYYAQRAEEIV